MQLYINIITYYVIILIYYIMDLNAYNDIVQKHIAARKNVINLKQMNTNYEHEKQEKDFQNIEKYKPITQSNKKLFEQIEKNDEMVENIVNTLPYYNNKDNKDNKEQLKLPFNDDKKEKVIYNFKEPLNESEEQFLESLENLENFFYIKINKERKYIQHLK